MADSAIQVMARGDFCDVEALHKGIQDIRSAAFIDIEALLLMASTLEAALGELPIYDPNTGQPMAQTRGIFGGNSNAPARQVAAYFRRAAYLPGAIASELAGAWAAFDNKILKPAEQAAGRPAPARKAAGTPSFRGVPEPHSRSRRAS